MVKRLLYRVGFLGVFDIGSSVIVVLGVGEGVRVSGDMSGGFIGWVYGREEVGRLV